MVSSTHTGFCKSSFPPSLVRIILHPILHSRIYNPYIDEEEHLLTRDMPDIALLIHPLYLLVVRFCRILYHVMSCDIIHTIDLAISLHLDNMVFYFWIVAISVLVADNFVSLLLQHRIPLADQVHWYPSVYLDIHVS